MIFWGYFVKGTKKTLNSLLHLASFNLHCWYHKSFPYRISKK